MQRLSYPQAPFFQEQSLQEGSETEMEIGSRVINGDGGDKDEYRVGMKMRGGRRGDGDENGDGMEMAEGGE